MNHHPRSSRPLALTAVLVTAFKLGCSSNSTGSPESAPEPGRDASLGEVGGGSGAGGTAQLGGGAAGTPSGEAAGAPGEFAVVSATVRADVSSPQKISSMLYGQNYWNWIPSWGAQVLAVRDWVKPLQLNLLRMGGTYPDISEPVGFDRATIDTFLEYAEEAGAAAVFQIPFVNMRDAAGEIVPSSPEGAAALVEAMTIGRSNPVKYFSIGNEPDLYEEQGRTLAGEPATGYTAERFCNSFVAYVEAIKQVDPTIQILGPELSWKYVDANDWLSPFLEGCGDQVDVVTVHRYPFDSTEDTAETVYADATSFRATLRDVRQKMVSAGVGEKHLAITEAHVTWDGTPSKPQLSGAPGTRAAALWVADQLGVAMEEGLFSLAFWSLSESYTLGFIDGQQPKPVYYALLTVARHFRSSIARVIDAPLGLSVYAGRNQESTPVLCVNKTANLQQLTIAIEGAPLDVPDAVVTLSPFSVTVVEVADGGGPPLVDVAPL